MMIHRFGIFVLLTLTVAGCSNSPQQPKSMALSFAQKCLEDLTDSLVAPKTLEIESFSVNYLPYNPNSLYEAKVYQDKNELFMDILDHERSKIYNSYTTKYSVAIKYNAKNTMGIPLTNYKFCEFFTEKTSNFKEKNFYISSKTIETNDDGFKSISSYSTMRDYSFFEKIKFKLNNKISIEGEEGSFSEEQLEEKNKILIGKRQDDNINPSVVQPVNQISLENQSSSTKDRYTLQLSEIISIFSKSKNSHDISEILNSKFYWNTEETDSIESFKSRKGQFYLDLNGDGKNIVVWDVFLEYKDKLIDPESFSLRFNAPEEYCFSANTQDRKSSKFMHCNISLEQLVKKTGIPHEEICKDREENDYGYSYGKYKILGNSKVLITSAWDGGSGGRTQYINITNRKIKGDPCSSLGWDNNAWWMGNGDQTKVDIF